MRLNCALASVEWGTPMVAGRSSTSAICGPGSEVVGSHVGAAVPLSIAARPRGIGHRSNRTHGEPGVRVGGRDAR